jgi:acyl-CoA thioester hydrolase
MNNVVHYSLFDSTVNGWLVDEGLLDPVSSASYGLVVETGCKYHAQLRFPQTVEAGMRISHIGRSSVRFEIGLFAAESDVAAANGFFVHVYVDRETQRPVPIEGRRREAFEALIM